MTTIESLTANLKRLREEHGLTQTDLAAKAGISTVMIGRYENGYVTPTDRTVAKLKTALGIDVSDSGEAGGKPEVELPGRIHHVFRLRPDETIVLDLPENLNQVEADRLAGFIKSLPF